MRYINYDNFLYTYSYMCNDNKQQEKKYFKLKSKTNFHNCVFSFLIVIFSKFISFLPN